MDVNISVSHAPSAGPAAGQRILVVDDNRDAADSLADLFDALGAQTAVAYGGVQAQNMMEKIRPTIAFIDIGMPSVDGHELASRIRASGHLAGVVLVALTGWSHASMHEAIKRSGFDHLLFKPADIVELMRLFAAMA